MVVRLKAFNKEAQDPGGKKTTTPDVSAFSPGFFSGLNEVY
jgi:hypothetical protein